MTPEEAATMIQNILWEVMLGEDVCAIAETPYWDTAANVDDTLPEGSETWYGQIFEVPALLGSGELTFLDNLGIWAIAGFIAYAGLPGAAIAFVPVAKRFVLAFKQHDLGGIVKVLIDFAEIAEIDTYGVGEAIQSLNVVMPDDDDPHTLYVMMSDEVNPAVDGAPQIQVVRKELSPAQVTPTTLRWNPDTNTVQQTPDGGTTWIDNPAADPRAGAGFLLPPRTTTDPRCDAAANMIVKLKQAVNIFEQEFSQLQAVNALVDVVLVFLPEVGIVLEALLAATEFLLTIGSAAISSAFTDDQWNLVESILYCDIASDGTVNQAQFDKILDDLHTRADTVVYDVLYTLFTLSLGVNGVSNAGATGDAVGDCSTFDCGWCVEWQLTLSPDLLGLTLDAGSWSSGDGYEGEFVRIYALDLGSLRVTHVEATYSCDGFNTGSGGQFNIQLYDPDIHEITRVITSEVGAHLALVWDGDALMGEIDWVASTQDSGFTFKLEHLLIRGLETPPTIGNIC